MYDKCILVYQTKLGIKFPISKNRITDIENSRLIPISDIKFPDIRKQILIPV